MDKKGINILLNTVFILFYCIALQPEVHSNNQQKQDSILILLIQAEGDSVTAKIIQENRLILRQSEKNQIVYLFDSLYQESLENNHTKTAIECARLIGDTYRINEEYDSALTWFDKEMQYRDTTIITSDLPLLYISTGICYDYLSDYDEAIQYYLKGLRIARENDLDGQVLSAANNLGIVYKIMKDYDRSLKYFKQAYRIANKLEDEFALMVVSNTLGVCYKNIEQYDSAMKYYDKSLKIAEKLDRKRDIAYALSNIGVVYAREGKLQEAIRYTLEGLELKKEINNRDGIARSYFSLGKYFSQLGEYESAMNFYHKGLSFAQEINNLLLERDFYLLMSYCFDSIGRYDSSNIYLKQYYETKDSIINREVKEKIEELQTQYETAEKQRQIEILEKDGLIQQEKIRRASVTRNFLLIGIALSALLAFLIYLIYRNRMRITKLITTKNLELREQQIREMEKTRQIENMQSMIRGQEEERQRMARELHDEIQNQLLVVVKTRLEKLKSRNEHSEEIEEAGKQIDLANEKTRRISHGMVPMVLQRFGLESAVEQIIRDALEAHPDLKINRQIIGLDDRIDPVIELNLYRILQELFNNILKHAGATEVTLVLSKTQQNLNLSLEDNGKGFDVNNPYRKEGMGMQNIQARLAVIGGKWEVQSQPGKGTNIEININTNHKNQTK